MGLAATIVNTIVYMLVYVAVHIFVLFCCWAFRLLDLDWYDHKNIAISGSLATIAAIGAFIIKFIIAISGIIVCLIAVLYIARSIFRKIWLVGDILLSMPPFPDFEDSGLFALVDRILDVFYVNDDQVLKAFGLSTVEVGLYSKDTIKKVLHTVMPDADIDDKQLDEIFDNRIDPNTTQPGSNKLRKKTAEEIKRELNPFYDNTLKAIDVEINNCIISRTAPIPIYLTEIQKTKIRASNEFAKTECYSSKVEAYIKANLQYLL
jgi:hypothetical protein